MCTNDVYKGVDSDVSSDGVPKREAIGSVLVSVQPHLLTTKCTHSSVGFILLCSFDMQINWKCDGLSYQLDRI